jgi:hypothetical protein
MVLGIVIPDLVLDDLVDADSWVMDDSYEPELPPVVVIDLTGRLTDFNRGLNNGACLPADGLVVQAHEISDYVPDLRDNTVYPVNVRWDHGYSKDRSTGGETDPIKSIP